MTKRQPRRHSPSSIALTCLVGLFLLGCEEDVFGTVEPEMLLVPEAGTTLDFGRVISPEPHRSSQTVTVRNVGEAALSLSAYELLGEDAQHFEITNAPSQVFPGASAEIVVRAPTTDIGTFSATLRFASNDRARPVAEFPLTARVSEPCRLVSEPSTLEFRVGDTKTVEFRATTSEPCVIDRIFVDRTVFPIVDEPELPLTVEPGTSLKLELLHVGVPPTLRGVPTRDLRVRDADGTEHLVRLRGEAPLAGCFSVFPNEILFPMTPIGAEVERRVTITNHCGRPAVVTSAVVGRGYDAYSVDGEYPMVFQGNETRAIFITYRPTWNPRGDNGRVTLNTNDAENPQFRIALTGFPALPDLEAFPYDIDFGTVVYRAQDLGDRSQCSSQARFATVHSSGAADLVVSAIEVVGDSRFEIVGVTVDAVPVRDFRQEINVPSGQTMKIALQFFPTRFSPEDHAGELRVVHNAGDAAVVRLKGRAAPDGEVSDSFEQLEGPKVDILWVIDDSCSMFDEQARLVANLSEFINYADSQSADYQMAITTTDSLSPAAGEFEFCYPHPRVVRHDYEARADAFACLFRVGTLGTFIEAGLGAAMRAVELALRTGDDPVRNRNLGFIREDAHLAIVWMSDEDDQSLESDQLLYDFFTSVKRPGQVSGHAIAGPVVGSCEMNRVDPGFRYFGMVERLGGAYHSICLEDWSPVLENLGLNVFRPLEEWVLSQPADPASLAVTVDGQPVTYDLSRTNGYTYDATQGVVRFYGEAVPGPGEMIDVDYRANCRP